MLLQETTKFLRHLQYLAWKDAKEPSESTTQLFRLLVDCGFIELAQQMWQQYLKPELLEQKKEIPDFIKQWLLVMLRFALNLIE